MQQKEGIWADNPLRGKLVPNFRSCWENCRTYGLRPWENRFKLPKMAC